MEDTHNRLFPVGRFLVSLSYIEIDSRLSSSIARLGIDVMRFVCNQHHLLFRKIIYRHAVLTRIIKRRVQALNGSKAEIDTIGISALEILHFVDLHLLAVDFYLLGKKVLIRSGIQEVVTRLLYDVCTIHEEKEIAVTLFV